MWGRRKPERGNALFLAVIVLGALTVLAGLTVVSVQGSVRQAQTDRFSAIATYAAESGVAAAMAYLRDIVHPVSGYTAFVSPSNTAPVSPPGIPGNNIAPGTFGNLMSADMQAWYSVTILNNRDDTGFASGVDQDFTVVIRVEGHGPNGAVAQLELAIHSEKPPPAPLVILGWRQLL
ncbi:MAG: hypothetical protein WKG01_02530 [Kofleriaceae bacterium]